MSSTIQRIKALEKKLPGIKKSYIVKYSDGRIYNLETKQYISELEFNELNQDDYNLIMVEYETKPYSKE